VSICHFAGHLSPNSDTGKLWDSAFARSYWSSRTHQSVAESATLGFEMAYQKNPGQASAKIHIDFKLLAPGF
jgi:hypothetical protein